MKKFAIEIKWGIRYAFVYIAWVFLEKSLGLYTQNISDYPLFSTLFYILALLLYFLAISDKKKNFFNNYMDWKQGCISGIYFTIAIAILMPLNQVIIHKAIAPEFFPNMIQHSIATRNTKPEVAKAFYNLTDYIYQSIFFALSIGVVFSAIVAYFLQTKELKK